MGSFKMDERLSLISSIVGDLYKLRRLILLRCVVLDMAHCWCVLVIN